MKVAFTTTDNLHIDAHFGSAKQIALYDVSSEGYDFLQTIEFGGNLEEDGNEDKLVPKVAALDGCSSVYVSAIGSSAANRLVNHKITPLRPKSEEATINETLDELVTTLQGTPLAWLRKVLQLQETKSFDFDEEG
jgi:nitrogen fixation protein NifX